MKKIFTLFAMSLFGAATSIAQPVVCDSTSNVIIYSNYDGGPVNINVDVNIPNLKIGVVSYEAVQINITGAYASNVTKVWYAGYNGGNDHCNAGITNTTITGVPANVDTIQIYPAATMSDPNGSPNMVCAYQCAGGNQGGCNTAEQVVHFFLTKFGESTFRFHRTMYGCWPTTIPVSGLGNCCLAPISLSVDEAQSAGGLNCYPNPASETVSISLNSAEAGDAVITFTDIAGRAVLTQNAQLNTGSNVFAVNTSELDQGIYTVEISSGGVCSRSKVEIIR